MKPALTPYFVLSLLFLSGTALSVQQGFAQDSQDYPSCFQETTNPFLLGFDRFIEFFKCPECREVITSCHLKRLEKIPEVILVGEHHNDEISKEAKETLFALASKGKIHIAAEVGFNSPAYPWVGTKSDYPGQNNGLATRQFYGIESPIPSSLVVAYFLQNSIFFQEINQDTWMLLIVKIMSSPLFRAAFEQLQSKNGNEPLYQEIGTEIKALLVETDRANKGTLKHPYEPNSFFKKTATLSQAQLRTYFTAIHVRIIDLAKSKFANRFKGLPLPSLLEAKDSKAMGFFAPLEWESGSPFDKLIIELRNRDFSGTISDLLCHLSGRTDRLVVLVGNAHVDGMMKILRGLSHDRVKIRYFQSFKPEDSAALLQELAGSPMSRDSK